MRYEHYTHRFNSPILTLPTTFYPSLNLRTDISSNSILKIQEILMYLGGGKCRRGLFKRCKWEGYSLILPLNSLSRKIDLLPHHPQRKKNPPVAFWD